MHTYLKKKKKKYWKKKKERGFEEKAQSRLRPKFMIKIVGLNRR